MTMRQSFPLIGIDFQGREHVLENEGYTPAQAGRNLAEDKGNLIKVFLDCSKIRTGRYAGGPPRKLVYCRKGYESYQTPGVGAGIMAEAMSQASLDVAAMLIKGWTKRGIRLEIDEREDNTDVFITPKGVASDDDRRDIEENKESLIAYIRQRNLAEAEAAAAKQTQADDESEEDKVSFRETIRRILPDLPKDFGISDVQAQLRSWRHEDLAADKKCLHNLMHWVVQEGYVKRGARGRYILVDEKVFARRSTTPKPDSADVIEPPPPATSNEIPQEPAQLPLAALQSTHAAVNPPDVTQELKPAAPVVATLLQKSTAQDALIRLAAELSAGRMDDAMLNMADKALVDMETEFLTSFTKAVGPIRDMIQSLKQMNAHRNQLLQAFSALKTS